MASEVQETKNQIWRFKQSIDKAEAERADWASSLANAQQVLEADPSNGETKAMIPELEEGLLLAEAALEPLLEQLAILEEKLPKAPEPAAPKFDPEKHPLLRKALEKTEQERPVVLNTGDLCEAQWTDKAWYKVKIQTILGSASAPKYHVRFLDYDDRMTVDRDAIRPLQSKRKREMDSVAVPSTTSQSAPVTSTPHVISGPASVNPNAQTARKELPVESAEPKKRKIPNKKALEKGVNSWRDWNSKGVGKKLAQKDSMFRSGTAVGSRVGFTGSGAGMTETNKRMRYNKEGESEAGEEDGVPHSTSMPASRHNRI